MLRRVDTFDCQHIATTAWVFAQYDWAPQDALQALAAEAERRGADMRPQHISMLLQVGSGLWPCALNTGPEALHPQSRSSLHGTWQPEP